MTEEFDPFEKTQTVKRKSATQTYIILVAILVIVSLVTSTVFIVKIPEGEMGLILKNGYPIYTIESGSSFVNPLYRVVRFEVETQRFSSRIVKKLSDGTQLLFDFDIDYKVNTEYLADIFLEMEKENTKIDSYIEEGFDEILEKVFDEFSDDNYVNSIEEIENSLEERLHEFSKRVANKRFYFIDEPFSISHLSKPSETNRSCTERIVEVDMFGKLRKAYELRCNKSTAQYYYFDYIIKDIHVKINQDYSLNSTRFWKSQK